MLWQAGWDGGPGGGVVAGLVGPGGGVVAGRVSVGSVGWYGPVAENVQTA